VEMDTAPRPVRLQLPDARLLRGARVGVCLVLHQARAREHRALAAGLLSDNQTNKHMLLLKIMGNFIYSVVQMKGKRERARESQPSAREHRALAAGLFTKYIFQILL
jgi:hypothetical protein